MTGRMIHRNAAKRMARGWQAGALIVALTAGALWALDLPGISGPAEGGPPKPVELVPIPVGAAHGTAVEHDEVASIAERLELARTPVKRPDPTPPEPGEGTIPASGSAWRYLGSIIEPSRKLALVSIDGSQRMIAEGRTVATGGRDVKLERVLPEAIVVLDSGQRLEIQKEERTGPSVAWVSPTAGGGGVVAGMNGSVGMDGGDGSMTEARARGMNPAESQRMREQARRMANRNRAGAVTPPPASVTNKGANAFSGMGGVVKSTVNSAAEAAEASGDATEDGSRGPM